ncbi:hypothetical protein RhiirB3_459228 [Rhizophagus irregularis]|nr:hypothetical protein RhiirB3_459228 [Rhizophagus irregularis]
MYLSNLTVFTRNLHCPTNLPGTMFAPLIFILTIMRLSNLQGTYCILNFTEICVVIPKRSSV